MFTVEEEVNLYSGIYMHEPDIRCGKISGWSGTRGAVPQVAYVPYLLGILYAQLVQDAGVH
jgi:hypothetical protein